MRIAPVREKSAAANILLSLDAKASLGNFIRQDKPSVHTQLHQSSQPVRRLFGARTEETSRRGSEFVEAGHPQVRWIRSRHEANQVPLHKLSAVEIDAAQDVPKGEYAFAVQLWSFDGLRKERRLTYSACEISSGQILDPPIAEALVTAGCDGRTMPNASNSLPDAGKG